MGKVEEEVDMQLKILLDEYKSEILTPEQTIELIKGLLVEDVKFVENNIKPLNIIKICKKRK